MSYDIVISGGLVIDGTGTPARRADLAVVSDRIVEIGAGTYPARTVIDATGCVVTPGFIDLHSHADFSVPLDPAAPTQLAQGVTTIITGNCGHSPFPIRNQEQARRSIGFRGEMPLSWNWSDAAGFGAEVMSAKPAVNVGLQLGHNPLRVAVMGEDDRPPTPAELDEMCAIITDSAQQPGVVGFSTGLIYMPGLFADTSELFTLVRAAAAADLLYSTHVRNETSELVAAVEEAITVAEQAGARLEISHLKAMGQENWGSVRHALDVIDAARDRGVNVTTDVYPYTASSTDLATRLPQWALDGGRPALLEHLADPKQRLRLAEALRARFGRDVDPDGVVIADLLPGDFDRYIGWSISKIGQDRGTDAAEAALDLLAANKGAVPMINHAMSDDDVCTVLAHPWVSVASDGWMLAASGEGRPHPRSFGTFARVLHRYVREGGVLTIEEAVRKMTSLPASRIGVGDRGVLRPGAIADVAVLDPDAVTDTSTFTDPWQLAQGVRSVLVNGTPAILDGEFTGRHAGRLVEKRKPA
ncbi:N-acyl-D-amino-acid deacylase [Rhodococcus wratislaviensis]|uniref:Aminoacylase n=1 Tax=Rhodococcus wratislaviensis TaxID=44752 RepID=A0AB38F6X6_RHOWR|nr:D-aminoacylase [Rhodococcus wratislaviensis]REE77504.1 N-acyl-D-amino-acid deacylase [Rhodococcus wratislaviensis]SPZ35382.1 aminoacylase [Rhodococcus wratislaviensis]